MKQLVKNNKTGELKIEGVPLLIGVNTKYTPYTEKWINDKINSDMQIIREEILKVVKPISIILLGGFGRGEGSVIVRNNTILPLKDYDILIVLDEKISTYELQTIKENAQKALGYGSQIYQEIMFSDFEVSMLPIQFSNLQYLADIKSYEIKTKSKILYGEDVRKEIKLSSSDIPLSGGARFLFRKAIGLLRRFSLKYLQNPPNRREKNCLIYECAKVYMDIGTALSLISGTYKPTYSEREEFIKKNFKHYFPELSKKLPHLSDRISFFTHLKLFPNDDTYNEIDAAKLLFDTRRDLGIVLKYYMNQYLGVKGNDWIGFSEDCYKKMKKEDLKDMIRHYLKAKFNINNMFFVRVANFLYQKYFSLRYILKLSRDEKILRIDPLREFPLYRLFTSSILLLFSLNKSGTLDKSLFNSFITSLSKIYPIKVKGSNDEERWNEAVNCLLKVNDINGELTYGFK